MLTLVIMIMIMILFACSRGIQPKCIYPLCLIRNDTGVGAWGGGGILFSTNEQND